MRAHKYTHTQNPEPKINHHTIHTRSVFLFFSFKFKYNFNPSLNIDWYVINLFFRVLFYVHIFNDGKRTTAKWFFYPRRNAIDRHHKQTHLHCDAEYWWNAFDHFWPFNGRHWCRCFRVFIECHFMRWICKCRIESTETACTPINNKSSD